MKKKDKTPARKQNKNPQSQSNGHKSGISFELDTWKQPENYVGSEFKGNKSMHAYCSLLILIPNS